MRNSVLILLLSAPGLAFAQANDEKITELQSLSWDQLCEQRESPEAMEELERRDLFTRRELRAISEDALRPGLRQEAVFCMLGEPEDVIPIVLPQNGARQRRDLMDAYTYPLEGPDTLIVHVRHRDDESTVVRFYEIEDEAVDSDIRRFGGPCESSPFSSRSDGMTRRCGSD